MGRELEDQLSSERTPGSWVALWRSRDEGEEKREPSSSCEGGGGGGGGNMMRPQSGATARAGAPAKRHL
jgi:hypothetical protein